VTQYDTIALDYQKISAAVPLRDAEWYSLQQRLGDLTGLSVLDLACGDGMGTRLLGRWGAARVVGVDISPQMIALARQQEEAQPLGIEYHVADAAALGRIGEFDRVTAAYLLHYAENREQLRQMVQTVYHNLEPGQHFVASIANVLQPPRPIVDHRKYGFAFRLMDETLHEGARLRGTLFLGGKTVDFDFHWLPGRRTRRHSEWRASARGRSSLSWSPRIRKRRVAQASGTSTSPRRRRCTLPLTSRSHEPEALGQARRCVAPAHLPRGRSPRRTRSSCIPGMAREPAGAWPSRRRRGGCRRAWGAAPRVREIAAFWLSHSSQRPAPHG